MNRAEFFSQIKKDIIQATKEIVAPFIDDDIKKVENFISELSGYKWYNLTDNLSEKFGDIKDYYINGYHISIYFNNTDIKAINRICPDCETMLQWISYESKFKCLKCEAEFYIKEETGTFQPTSYPLKQSNGQWLIGLK